MFKKSIWLLALLATCLAQTPRAFELFGPRVSLQSVNRNPGFSGRIKSFEEPFIEMMLRLAGQDPNNSHLAALVSEQDSYDYNANLQTTDLLYRSGFKFEIYNSTSLDGYITQLVRIINPKADRSELKQPPVVLYAGQGASPAVFLMTAIGRGHPSAWPRDDPWGDRELDGNRSLALTLANHGYDVWLVPARGVDKANRRRQDAVRSSQLKDLFAGVSPSRVANDSSATSFSADGLKSWIRDLDASHFWSFSDDQIIKFEFGIQLDLVLEVTGYERISLINYSNGGFIAFGFMAYEPEFSHRHLDTIISIAPAVFIDRFNLILGARGLLSTLSLPNQPYPNARIDAVARKGFLHLCKSKALRYSICKLLLNQLYGHSDLFKTHIELAILEYIGQPLSARGLRQTLQVAHSGKFQNYDFGLLGNLIEYNKPRAPTYDLSAIKHERIFIISGSKDAIVSNRCVSKLINELNCKPNKWISVAGYNHLDLLAGHDNTHRVNLPILQILDERDFETGYEHESESDARSINLAPFRLMGHQNGAASNKVSRNNDQKHIRRRRPKLALPRGKRPKYQWRRPAGESSPLPSHKISIKRQ